MSVCHLKGFLSFKARKLTFCIPWTLASNKLPTRFVIFCLEPEIFDVRDAKMTKKWVTGWLVGLAFFPYQKMSVYLILILAIQVSNLPVIKWLTPGAQTGVRRLFEHVARLKENLVKFGQAVLVGWWEMHIYLVMLCFWFHCDASSLVYLWCFVMASQKNWNKYKPKVNKNQGRGQLNYW